MGKHKRRRSYDSDDYRHQRKRTPKCETESDEEFSFLNHKRIFHKILLGYNISEQLVDDPADFWLFLTKYEALLKRSMQSVLSIKTEAPQTDSIIPSNYDKNYLMNFKLKPSKNQMTPTSFDNEGKSIDDKKVEIFLTIVRHYLDFKQKERFKKLKKLRKFQANLPIAPYEKEIVHAVKNESILILAGDTGCGKSTQVCQYLYNAGFDKVACTQPRRIACIGLAKRVSHEMLCEYESEVGYQIRFEKQKTKHTKILFITEGLLLRQLSDDENLTQYSVIIIDEIHERNLYGDFLLGICKCLLRARPEIKIVLMSATININLFSNFFDEEQAKIIEVPGRLFPIKLHYMPHLKNPELKLEAKSSRSERLNPEPYIQLMSMIDKKYPKEEKGDLLIFLSGLNEIQSVVDAAKEYNREKQNWIILPLHSSLSMQDQDKVFDYAPEGMRKCIVSTNISETSLTIDGIRFVIDSGKMKEMTYDPNYKMQRLKEMWISKASAEQRKGRAGRTGPGICYRLYSEKEFYELENYTKAEIHRVPLESLLLQMISMGLPNARLFPFIEPPSIENIENSILALKQLEALTIDEKLTSIGKALSKIPVEVFLGKMLLIGSIFRQLQPTLTLAAALNVQSPFTNRAFRDLECEKLRADCESTHGDPITLINLYREWLLVKKSFDSRDRDRENSRQWCRKRGLEEQRFYEITKLKNQLESLLRECQLIEEKTDEKLTAAERSIRAGEKKYLGSLKRAHKMEAPRERRLLKADDDEMDDEVNDGRIDIRDVEFRLSMGSKINDLVLNATATSGTDLIMLKLILMSGLYPKIAISDEFNYLKSMNEQFFHTKSKPYISMHPMSYFAKNFQELHVSGNEMADKVGIYKSKYPLSSKHQIICYLSILETTKPYLMNSMRMPAAQTLLLFAQEIDCNLTFSRIICDSWLCLDFPMPETGQTLVARSSNLRNRWNKLISMKLDNEMGCQVKTEEFDALERDLANFMNCEVVYTIKRLLPADLKNLYKGNRHEDCSNLLLNQNPFCEDFACIANDVKGGVYVTEHITYGCVDETDWSLNMAEEIYMTEFECPGCNMIFNMTNIQKLQHFHVCKPAKNEEEQKEFLQPTSSNQKLYKCSICKKEMYMTNIDILKHKKICKVIKEESI
ncbi:hypothetical protein PVAND_009791 [Polypedilum vanderplanki]|uniref:RNA helicase n=1 Tax=Polypedilum vanderplanki TaxID=319348 RepID=A0A9J6CEM4_POLVA|nr:hypothetical protein PVAND_009791 [Polypedilum vanderplanki]